MSLHTNFHAPRMSLSGRIQIGHKSGFYYYYYLLFIYLSAIIKPPRHRFGFSLAWGWQYAWFSLLRKRKDIRISFFPINFELGLTIFRILFLLQAKTRHDRQQNIKTGILLLQFCTNPRVNWGENEIKIESKQLLRLNSCEWWFKNKLAKLN